MNRGSPDPSGPPTDGRRLALVVVLALMCGLFSRAAQAQFRGGVEVARERVTYHFENPSSFDTAELVPHFFEQHYRLDNVWLTAAAAYTAGVEWETTAGLTPARDALATDYDTFFNPGAVTWIVGTTGDAGIRSWRLAQQARVGRAGPVDLTGGYRVRVDTADFRDGDKTIVRNGVLIEQSVVTTREYTRAQRHEVFLGARVIRALASRWQLVVSADVAPAAIDRLAIDLPDKYPGVTLVYQTVTFTAQGQAELSLTSLGWPISVGVHAGTTANYSGRQRVARSIVGASVAIGRTW